MNVPVDLIRTGEAAALLGVHPDTVRGLVRRGKLAAVRVAGGELRLRRADVLRLLEPVTPDEGASGRRARSKAHEDAEAELRAAGWLP